MLVAGLGIAGFRSKALWAPFVQDVTGDLGNLQITITVINSAGCGDNPGTVRR
jgi:hypothetical protein